MAPGVERRSMFGYPCAFVNGHMFCGLHQDSLVVRLPEARREAMVASGARIFEPMPGKPMKEYVVAPTEIVADRERLRALLHEALEHASSLAPREKKPAKKAAAAPSASAPAPKKRAAHAKKPAKKAAKKTAKRAAAKRTTTKAARKAPAKKAKARRSTGAKKKARRR
jgi:TfoX/Sxy family transcriptional regulator of competence genes